MPFEDNESAARPSEHAPDVLCDDNRQRSSSGPNNDTGSGQLWAQLAGVAAIIAIAGVLLLVPKGLFFGKALAVGAVLIAIPQVLGLIAWCGDGYLGLPDLKMMLWRVFAVRMLALSAVVAFGFWIHTGLTVTATAAFALLFISHRRTPRRIKRRTEAKGVPLGKRKKRYWSYDQKRKVLTLAVSHSFAEAVADIFNIFGSWRRILALAPVAIAVALILCTAALAVGIFTGKWIEHTSSRPGATGAGTISTPKPPPPPTPKPQPPTSPGKVAPRVPRAWDGKCGAVRQYSGATTKAQHSVRLLYESESGMTSLQEGCFGQILPHRYTLAEHKWETYFTTVGTNLQSGEDLTFAIDSEHFGPCIFKWAVAPLIQTLIGKVGPVGGVGRFPHYLAGPGDFYLVRSRGGIFVFIRHRPTESYIELPPTVARAWLGDMKAVHKWLWPSPPESGLRDETLFQLWSDNDTQINHHPQIVGTVKWIPSTGFAERGRVPYPATPVIELNLSELTTLANSA